MTAPKVRAGAHAVSHHGHGNAADCIDQESKKDGDQRAPKKRSRQHPERLGFVTINPQHQNQIKRNRQSRRHHANQEGHRPGLNSDQEKHNQPQQQSDERCDDGADDLDGALDAGGL